MKRIMFVSLIGIAACGGSEAPQLSAVTLSQTEIRYGDEFFLSFEATDKDGDLDGATISIKVRGPEDDPTVDLDASVRVTEVAAGATEANMAVALKLSGQMPLGVYKVELRVTDDSGNESEPTKARVNLIPGGGNPGGPISACRSSPPASSRPLRSC